MATVTVSHVYSMGLEHKYIQAWVQPCFINYCSNKNVLFMIPEIPSDTSGTPASLQIFIIGLYYIKFTITYPLFTVLKYCSSRITPWETCKFIQPLWRALFRDSLLTSIFVLEPSKMQSTASWLWGENAYIIILSHSILTYKSIMHGSRTSEKA